MIEEIVPFSEHLGAIFVGAAQESDDSSGLWAFVLVNDVFLGARDVLLDSDLMEVKVFP